MKNVYKLILTITVAIAIVYSYGTKPIKKEPKPLKNVIKQNVSQKDIDAMMDNWFLRNKDRIKRTLLSQEDFDSMINDWLKRREAKQRQESSHHGHNH